MSATVTEATRQDAEARLGLSNGIEIVGPLYRPNLHITVKGAWGAERKLKIFQFVQAQLNSGKQGTSTFSCKLGYLLRFGTGVVYAPYKNRCYNSVDVRPC